MWTGRSSGNRRTIGRELWVVMRRGIAEIYQKRTLRPTSSANSLHLPCVVLALLLLLFAGLGQGSGVLNFSRPLRIPPIQLGDQVGKLEAVRDLLIHLRVD